MTTEAILKLHPHKCSYLDGIVKYRPHTGDELIETSMKIGAWLDTNNIKYVWGSEYSIVFKGVYTYYRAGSTIQVPFHKKEFGQQFIPVIQGFMIATKVAFKHKEDLLALKLCWGIND